MSLQGYINKLCNEVSREFEKEFFNMPDKVILSVGDEEFEAGTVEDVLRVLGRIFHEIDEQSNVAYGIAKYIASVAEGLIVDADSDEVNIKVRIE